jgi:pilus assembly protein TadC
MNEQERLFVKYWEEKRERESSLLFQLLTGLPIGILFSLPILLILLSGRWWYKRADMVANARMSPWILSIAVFIIAVFVAILYKRHLWDMKEQQYLEIKAREKRQADS